MSVNIDKIYNMLSWDNDEKIQIRGIKESANIKSLNVFILPILPNNSKSVWENCARILVTKNNGELKPYLTQILRWLQDMNWPGAELIYDRLLTFSYQDIETPIRICLCIAEKTNDFPWKKALVSLMEKMEVKN